ncbi:hypothetical protein D9V86_12105, partial [Bacteroidetes/Chlorobi group bacterium ChocPot_Mid]
MKIFSYFNFTIILLLTCFNLSLSDPTVKWERFYKPLNLYNLFSQKFYFNDSSYFLCYLGTKIGSQETMITNQGVIVVNVLGDIKLQYELLDSHN